MADSSITTYFGRPSWHCYGNGNVNPAQGGLVYGDYLKTHNINPHTGENEPENVQIYARAMRGQQKVIEPPGPRKMCKSVKMYSKRQRSPEPPRPSVPKRAVTAEDRAEQKRRLPVMPDKTEAEHNFPVKTPKLRPEKMLTQQDLSPKTHRGKESPKSKRDTQRETTRGGQSARTIS